VGRRIALHLAVLSILISTVYGQSGLRDGRQPYIERVGVGFSMQARENAWTPATVTINNPGPETDVDLVVTASEEGAVLPMLSRTRLHLPAGCSRAYSAPVFTADATEMHFQVGVSRKSVSIRSISDRQAIVLGLSVSGEGVSCSRKLGESVSSFFFNSTQPFPSLPERWQGYESVDVIVLGDLPVNGITVRQEQALIDWVRAGGLLIVSPGVVDPHYEDTLIEKHLPVTILGARLVNSLPGLEKRYGKIDFSGDRTALVEVAVRDGTVRISSGDFPLVVTRELGLGRITFVAFDIRDQRIKAWPHLQSVYADLMRGHANLPARRLTSLSARAAELIDGQLGVKVMSRLFVGIFLGLNIAIVAGAFLLLRRHRSRAFLFILIAAPIWAGIIYIAGWAGSGTREPMLAGLHVVRSASGDSAGVGVSYYGMLASNEVRTDVSFGDDDSAFPRFLSRGRVWGKNKRTMASSIRESYEVADGDLNWLRGLHLRPKSVVRFQTSRKVNLEGSIDATATFGDEGITFKVTNNSAKPFTHGVAIYNRNAVAINDLAPGATTSVTLVDSTLRGAMAGYSRSNVKSEREMQADKIVQGLYSVSRGNALVHTGAHVVGWVGGAVGTLKTEEIENLRTTNEQTLWVVRAKELAPASGEGVLLPMGAPTLWLDSPSSASSMGGWRSFKGTFSMELDFGVPEPLRGMKAEEIEIVFRVGQVSGKRILKVYNFRTGGYDTIIGNATDTGADDDRDMVSLSPPEDYIDPQLGIVRVDVRLITKMPDSVAATSSRDGMIEALDMKIRGVCK
jgi:hypothetical protein